MCIYLFGRYLVLFDIPCFSSPIISLSLSRVSISCVAPAQLSTILSLITPLSFPQYILCVILSFPLCLFPFALLFSFSSPSCFHPMIVSGSVCISTIASVPRVSEQLKQDWANVSRRQHTVERSERSHNRKVL